LYWSSADDLVAEKNESNFGSKERYTCGGSRLFKEPYGQLGPAVVAVWFWGAPVVAGFFDFPSVFVAASFGVAGVLGGFEGGGGFVAAGFVAGGFPGTIGFAPMVLISLLN